MPGYLENGSSYSLTLKPVQGDVGALLLADVLGDRRLARADGGDVAALCPELPVPELVPEVRMPVEHEKGALPPRIAHEARDAGLGRDAGRHVDVVGHEVPLYDLDALPLAELPGTPGGVLAASAVDRLPPMLWRGHDVILAEPLRVREAVGLLGHGDRLPSGA